MTSKDIAIELMEGEIKIWSEQRRGGWMWGGSHACAECIIRWFACKFVRSFGIVSLLLLFFRRECMVQLLQTKICQDLGFECIYVYIYIYTCTYIHVYMYIYMYTHIHIYIYTYLYIYTHKDIYNIHI